MLFSIAGRPNPGNGAHIVATMPADENQALQTASAMNGRGNKSVAAQVTRATCFNPESMRLRSPRNQQQPEANDIQQALASEKDGGKRNSVEFRNEVENPSTQAC